MSRLFLDLAEAECQLATLAMASGRADLAVRSLDRASHYLSLRRQDPDPRSRALPMWARRV